MLLPPHIGTSSVNYISETVMRIIKLIDQEVEETTILDIGCGKGMYGYILKCYLPKLKLYGIDPVIPEDFKPILEMIYENIFVGNVQNFNFDKKYDITFINHILEHLLLKDAISLVKQLQKFSNKLIVGVPNGRPNHIYKDFKSPHSHKWGIQSFPWQELNLQKVKSNYNQLFVWDKNSSLKNKRSVVNAKSQVPYLF